MCVCGGGGRVRFSTSPSVRIITDHCLLIMNGPYNKKFQGSLCPLSFLRYFLFLFVSLK